MPQQKEIIARMPLSDSQMGLYLECAENEESLQYNIFFEYRFDQSFNAEKLTVACNKVLSHYAAFSIGVEVKEGKPEMVLFKNGAPKTLLLTLSEEEYANYKRHFERPFHFDGSELCRVSVIQTPECLYLLTDMHHLIYDGTSTFLFEQGIEKAYLGLELPEEEHTLFDAVEAEQSHSQSTELKASYDYFDHLLDGVETDSNLLPDLNGKEVNHCTSLIVDLPSPAADVKDFAQANDTTENMVLLSAFAYALAKYSGQNEALFTSINSGRRGKPLENTMGFFVRTFPLFLAIDEESSVSEYIKRVKENYLETMCHDDASFVELSSRYGIRSDVKYVYQNNILNDIVMNGKNVEKIYQENDDALSNLDFVIMKKDDGFQLRLTYRTALYSEGNIRAFADLYACIVEGMLHCRWLKDINLISPSARAFVDTFNHTEKPYDHNKTVWDTLNEAMRGNEAKPAVCYKDCTITYGEFDSLTARLASFLATQGIGEDDFVSVLIPRNEQMAVTAWGIVRAGAAYQPLDPAYPPERLNFMVKDAKARMLIADRNLRGLLDQYEGEVLYTDEIAQLPAAERFEPLDTPNAASVIIYTSGTTGVPKGCVLENRNIACFYHNHASVIGLEACSKVANYASFGFDAGIMDIFTTLMAGATLYVIPDEIRLDILRINQFYKDNGITHGFITTQVGRMFAQMADCPTLKTLTIGGEKLVPLTPPQHFAINNGYGPSETLAYVCHHQVCDDSAIQPIGTPMGNTKLYVIDPYSRMLPPGACGELCIAGYQVGRGYFNQLEKTANVFVANPFCQDEGYGRMYRTGDIVRLLPSGEMDFVGRRDGQVKIRGFRIELTEVEQVIRQYPGIQNATVQAFDSPSGGKFIAAYVVADSKLSAEAIADFVRQRKPDYMVPSVIMQIERIPLNVNAKVDRKKLPVPEYKADEIVPPANEMQQRIFDNVAEILGHTEFGITNDLFASGLSSIGVIKLNVLLADAFGVSLRIKDLKNNSTIEKLEQLILSLKEVESHSASEDYPLTKTQEGIYIECLSNPNTTSYNVPLLLKLDKEIDVSRLKKAIVQAVEAHAYMDMRLFTAADGSIHQRSNETAPFNEQDIAELSATDIASVKEELMQPFTLIGERLFRITLIHATELYLFIDLHHIIGDGTSINILLHDIGLAYAGTSIEKESFTGFDVAAAESQQRTHAELEQCKAHYDRFFSEIDSDFLPASDRHPHAPLGSGSFETASATGRVSEVETFCRQHSVSVNSLMLSVFGLVLAKFNAEDYSVFSTIYNGRNDSRTSRTFAMMVKTLPVYVALQHGTPAQLAGEVSEQYLDSMVNDLYSFAEISRQYGIKNDIMFIYQGDDFGFDTFCGKGAEEVPMNLKDKKTPISLQVFLKEGCFSYVADYDNERYTDALIRSLVSAFDYALGQFVRCASVDEVTLVSEEMCEQLDRYNDTEAPIDESRTMASWFEATAEQYPNNTAVHSQGKEYSYAQIADLSARVANYLRNHGIGRNQFIPVLVNRNEYMAIGALGVIRSGAAYEPLDPSYPPERLKFMIADAEAKMIIADRKLAKLVCDIKVPILYTDEIASLPEAPNYHTDATPNDAFVIIYTSGTTGVPKGNVLAHRNPVSLFSYHLKDAGLKPDSRTAYYTGFSFDAGMLDLFAALLSGGTLYIVPESIRMDLGLLDKFFCKHRITHSSMTMQMGSLLVKMTHCDTLRYFMVGGEKLVPFMPPEGLRFVNGYGPSECTIYSSGFDVQDDTLYQPIGKPIDNMKYYVVDKQMHRLPFGAAGELCIAGKQVGLGYRNRPEKNAEAFGDNPFSSDSDYCRLYHTGDIVRELTDGNYDFVGRRDGQVKIRGFRVELTEIEQVIRDYTGIENATVQAFDDPAGGKFIAAYVVSNSVVDIEDLSLFIGKAKPSYMVPAAFVQLERIPLTANGKVDKRALPTPERKSSRQGAEPANDTERTFCNIFAEVLGLEKVFADDDFFSIGGSSISAAQVVVKCVAAGYNVVFKNLFENSTPRSLASFSKSDNNEDIVAPSGAEKEKYDYSCLDYNVPENLPHIRNIGIGDVLLTGVTGFLGSHVYRALMEQTDAHVACIVRSKAGLSAETRFKMIMIYYFEDWFNDQYEARTSVIDADLADIDLDNKLAHQPFDTIINTAANVKHFARLNTMLKDNFKSVEQLISLAEKRNAKLIQASSLSVCGESVNGSIPKDFRFREHNLNIGQSLENKYVYTKYLAEQAIVDAISRGRIRGKIIRLGNLAARDSDGEFQVNPSNSGLFKLIQGYVKLGCYPIDSMDASIEFSPIDRTAEALVLLASTPDEFTVFHAKNCHVIHYGYLINALNHNGIHIEIVERDIFEDRYHKAIEEEEDLTAYTGFIAYLQRKDDSVTDMMIYNDDDSNTQPQQKQYVKRVKVLSDPSYTTKALYRLGFAWPLTSKEYLDSMVIKLDEKAFF